MMDLMFFWMNDGECPRRLLLKQVIKNNLSRGESEDRDTGLGFASFLHPGLAHLASENFQAARDTFEDVLDELEDDSIVCSSARTTLYCSEQ
jgi:hypothetical protein